MLTKEASLPIYQDNQRSQERSVCKEGKIFFVTLRKTKRIYIYANQYLKLLLYTFNFFQLFLDKKLQKSRLRFPATQNRSYG